MSGGERLWGGEMAYGREAFFPEPFSGEKVL